MTEERKYIVFVSSTKVDLRSYRQKVIEAIIRLQQIPFCMEYFPATSGAALEFIDEQIYKSDIFLLLLGQSLGTKVGEETFIQHEYRMAEKYGKDILVLTLSAEKYKADAIMEFRERIGRAGSTSSPIISTFSTEEESGIQAYHALSHLIKRKNEESRGGWIEATPYDKVGELFFNRYIERIITFRPEHCQAGLQILLYFGRIIEQKYPEASVAATIKQNGNTISLIIETEDGRMESVERVLDDYADVVFGKKPPEALFDDPIAVMELRYKLDLAQAELRVHRQLFQHTKDQYEARVTSLETQVSQLL